MDIAISHTKDGAIAALWIGDSYIAWSQIRRLDPEWGGGKEGVTALRVTYVDATAEDFPITYDQLRPLLQAIGHPGYQQRYR